MMQHTKDLPVLRGEALYIPFVAAIIERTSPNGKGKQILVQTRNKSSDGKYSGCLEIPGGKIRAFEDVYEALRREVKEETGLDVAVIQLEDSRVDYVNREDTSTLLQPFCVTQMSNGPFVGLIFICEASGVLLKEADESKDIRWIDCDALRDMINQYPERIYTAFLAPLKKYVRSHCEHRGVEGACGGFC